MAGGSGLAGPGKSLTTLHADKPKDFPQNASYQKSGENTLLMVASLNMKTNETEQEAKKKFYSVILFPTLV